MALYGTHPPMKIADEPVDPVWRWFILNGPHGERFSWKRFGELNSDLEFLQQFIDEYAESIPHFKEKAREISLKSLQSDNRIMIRTAIQVLTVLGTDQDMELIREFVQCGDTDIENDAKCALFERGIRIKRIK